MIKQDTTCPTCGFYAASDLDRCPICYPMAGDRIRIDPKCWTFKATNHHSQDIKAAEKTRKTVDKVRDIEPQRRLF